jgi:hypothetical protein
MDKDKSIADKITDTMKGIAGTASDAAAYAMKTAGARITARHALSPET